MAYLLLLALVFTVGFVLLIFPDKKSPQRVASLSFVTGLGLLSLGYLTQIVLGFHLNDSAAHLFYWSREMLALAWLGHGALLLIFGDRSKTRWLTYALVAASVVSLVLVGATQVTKAEDWFRPATPIYAQITDLLATNRPTRWGGWLLNAYGAIGLAAAAVLNAKNKTWLVAGLFLIGLGSLLLPVLILPAVANAEFYLIEFLAPLFLYLGFSKLLTLHPVGKARKRRVA